MLDNNTTHFLIALIWAAASVGIIALEFFFAASVHAIDDLFMFFAAIQTIGLAFGNAYYVGNLVMNAQGITTSTENQQNAQK